MDQKNNSHSQYPLVSIITPSFNSSEFIEETIKSVLTQTYKNWEMIIVDDKSKDNTINLIKKYIKQDPRIQLIKLSTNSGPAVARNKAIDIAKGRYIAFLDADDLWMSNKLEKQIAYISKKKCSLVYSSYVTIDRNGTELNKRIQPPLKLSYNDLLKTNYIGCLTAMYDTEKVGKLYMPLIKKRQDYGLWLKILKKTNYAYGQIEVLAKYRINSNSVSSNKFELLKYNYLLFRKCENFSIIHSIYYLTWNIFIKVFKKR